MIGSLFHTGPETAFLPAARAVYTDLVARKLDNRYALHVRSSQAFALNLFAPLTDTGRLAVLAAVGLDAVVVEPAVFEYSDAADRLTEARPGSPHRTQVDVLLRGSDTHGTRLCALIEVNDHHWVESPWSAQLARGGSPSGPARCSSLRRGECSPPSPTSSPAPLHPTPTHAQTTVHNQRT